ncbi:MAG: urease accessory protein UreD [Flavobacteriaceae bacterium]
MINKDNSIHSVIKISCVSEGEKTLLEDGLFDIPYKVVHYGSKLLSNHLELMMMCASPGIMDGDFLDISVDCKEGSEMLLFSQSYNKLHPMKKGASQHMKISVEKDAIFQYIPHPAIPFKESIFDIFNEAHVEASGHLLLADIISGGRIHSDEKFEFTRIHSRSKIHYDKKLILYDNQLLDPAKQNLEDMFFFEGFSHQATLIVVSEYATEIKNEMDEMFKEQFTDLKYGFTLCNDKAIMLRALGTSGDAMYKWLTNIGDMCRSYINFKKKEAATNEMMEERKEAKVKVIQRKKKEEKLLKTTR